jgi:hypothetical protein
VNDVTFCKSYVTLNNLSEINFSAFVFHFLYEKIDVKKTVRLL